VWAGNALGQEIKAPGEEALTAEKLTALVVVAGMVVVGHGLAWRNHQLKAAPGVAQVVAVGVGR
jgi:hypothetical protein